MVIRITLGRPAAVSLDDAAKARGRLRNATAIARTSFAGRCITAAGRCLPALSASPVRLRSPVLWRGGPWPGLRDRVGPREQVQPHGAILPASHPPFPDIAAAHPTRYARPHSPARLQAPGERRTPLRTYSPRAGRLLLNCRLLRSWCCPTPAHVSSTEL